jgi:hypothetical protein
MKKLRYIYDIKSMSDSEIETQVDVAEIRGRWGRTTGAIRRFRR